MTRWPTGTELYLAWVLIVHGIHCNAQAQPLQPSPMASSRPPFPRLDVRAPSAAPAAAPKGGPPPPSPEAPHQAIPLSLLNATVAASICMAVDGACVMGLSWVIDLEPFPLTVGTSRKSGLECIGGSDLGCTWVSIEDYLYDTSRDSQTYVPLQLVVHTRNITTPFQMGHTSVAANVLRQLESLSLTCAEPVPVYAPYILSPMIMALSAAPVDRGLNATAVVIALAMATAADSSNATWPGTATPPPDPSITSVSSSGAPGPRPPPNTTSDAATLSKAIKWLHYPRLHAPPPATVMAPRLRRLVINDCALTGQLPPASFWLQLPSLAHLDLSRNLLSGPLPATFGPSPPLIHLNLSRNRITGPLTDSLARYGSCGRVLDLSFNDLRGHVPGFWLDSACSVHGKDRVGVFPRRRGLSEILSYVFSWGGGDGLGGDEEATGPDGGRVEFDESDELPAGLRRFRSNKANTPPPTTARPPLPSASSKTMAATKVTTTSASVKAVLQDSQTANLSASTVTVAVGSTTTTSGAYAFWLSYPSSYMYGGDGCPVHGVAWNERIAAHARNGTGGPEAGAYNFTVLLYGNPHLTTPGGEWSGYATAPGEFLYFNIRENACTAFTPLRVLLILWGSFGGCALAFLVIVALHALLSSRRAKVRVAPTRDTAKAQAGQPPVGGAAGSDGTSSAAPSAAPAALVVAGAGASGKGATEEAAALATAAAGSETAPGDPPGGPAPTSALQQQQQPGPRAAGDGGGPIPAIAAVANSGGGASLGVGGGMARVIIVAHARAYSVRAAHRLSVYGVAVLDFVEAAVMWLVFGVPWGALARGVVAITAHTAAVGLTYVMSMTTRVEYCKTVRKCLPFIYVLVPVLSLVSVGLTLFLMRATRKLAGIMSHRVVAARASKAAEGAAAGPPTAAFEIGVGAGVPPVAHSSSSAADGGDKPKLQKDMDVATSRSVSREGDEDESYSTSSGRLDYSIAGDSDTTVRQRQQVTASASAVAEEDEAEDQQTERWTSGLQPVRTKSTDGAAVPHRSSSACATPHSRPGAAGVLLPSPSWSASGSPGAPQPGLMPLPVVTRSRQASPRSPARVVGFGSTGREPSPLGRPPTQQASVGGGGGGAAAAVAAAGATASRASGRPVAEGLEETTPRTTFTSAAEPGADPGDVALSTPQGSGAGWRGRGQGGGSSVGAGSGGSGGSRSGFARGEWLGHTYRTVLLSRFASTAVSPVAPDGSGGGDDGCRTPGEGGLPPPSSTDTTGFELVASPDGSAVSLPLGSSECCCSGSATCAAGSGCQHCATISSSPAVAAGSAHGWWMVGPGPVGEAREDEGRSGASSISGGGHPAVQTPVFPSMNRRVGTGSGAGATANAGTLGSPSQAGPTGPLSPASGGLPGGLAGGDGDAVAVGLEPAAEGRDGLLRGETTDRPTAALETPRYRANLAAGRAGSRAASRRVVITSSARETSGPGASAAAAAAAATSSQGGAGGGSTGADASPLPASGLARMPAECPPPPPLVLPPPPASAYSSPSTRAQAGLESPQQGGGGYVVVTATGSAGGGLDSVHATAHSNAWLQDRLNALAALSSTGGTAGAGSVPNLRMPSVAAAAAVAAAATTPRRIAATAPPAGAGSAEGPAAAAGADGFAADVERLRPGALVVVTRFLLDFTFGRPGSGLLSRFGTTVLSVLAIVAWSCPAAPLAAVAALLAVLVVAVQVVAYSIAWLAGLITWLMGRRQSLIRPDAYPGYDGGGGGRYGGGWLGRFDVVASYLRLELTLFLGIHTHVAGWLLYVPLSLFAGVMYGLGYLWGKDAVPAPWVFIACQVACLAGVLLLLIELACGLPAWEYGVCRYPYIVAVRTAYRTAPGGVGAAPGTKRG